MKCNLTVLEMKRNVQVQVCGESGSGVEGDNCRGGDERRRQGASSSPVRKRNVKENYLLSVVTL